MALAGWLGVISLVISDGVVTWNDASLMVEGLATALVIWLVPNARKSDV